MRRNVAKIFALIAILLLCTGCGKEKDDIKNYNATLASTIHNGKDTWEIYKCKDKQIAIVVLNNKIHNKKNIDINTAEIAMMQLPDINRQDGTDITKNNQLTEFTWSASLIDSAKYIKYLQDSGYTNIFEADTQQFIEIYMQKSDNTKRLIITQSYICIYDVDKFSFSSKDIDNYIYETGGKSNG